MTRKYFYTFSFIVCIAGFVFAFGCGGSQTPPQDATAKVECKNDAESLLEQSPVCNPVLLDAFEKKLTQWKSRCSGVVDSATSDRIAQASAESESCCENTAALNKEGAACQARVAEIRKSSECAAPECEKTVTALGTVLSDCTRLEKNGFDLQGATTLQKTLQLRIDRANLGARITSFRQQCADASELAGSGKTDDAVTVLVTAAVSMPENEDGIADETLETQLKESMAECADALKSVVAAHVKHHAEILKDKRAEKEVLPWMSSYRNLSETASRLKEAGALTIAPGLTDDIDKLLLDYDKKRNELESAEISMRDAISKRALTEGKKKCSNASSKIAHFSAKIEEHKAAGNEGKVQAYGRQLDKAKKHLEELTEELKDAAQAKPFDDEKNRKLLDAARKAGCPVP